MMNLTDLDLLQDECAEGNTSIGVLSANSCLFFANGFSKGSSMAAGFSPSFLTNFQPLPPEEVIFGCSKVMRELRAQVQKIANANVPVLIEGESGTGKDILARLIHRSSPLRSRPFVKVNCPAIPGTLIESELFGYERGAFTGAYSAKVGRVELAHNGSLFLDEISELDLGLQSKLLQLLQDGQFCRIGGQTDTKVEVRVICATNRSLEREVASGKFRQDLFYRINVLSLRVPPLRERVADIPVLMSYFLDLYSDKYNAPPREFSTEMLAAFQQYHWPGNVRELENFIRRFVILGDKEILMEEMKVPRAESFEMDFVYDGSMSLKVLSRKAVRQLETKIILNALKAHLWNRKKAAKALNISYRALLYKLKESGTVERVHRADVSAEDAGAISPIL
jgi:two-component system response regulator AtoC